MSNGTDRSKTLRITSRPSAPTEAKTSTSSSSIPHAIDINQPRTNRDSVGRIDIANPNRNQLRQTMRGRVSVSAQSGRTSFRGLAEGEKERKLPAHYTGSRLWPASHKGVVHGKVAKPLKGNQCGRSVREQPRFRATENRRVGRGTSHVRPRLRALEWFAACLVADRLAMRSHRKDDSGNAGL
ncbi:hypothetical protein MRX96_058961 [Rhipicephalus microplus]